MLPSSENPFKITTSRREATAVRYRHCNSYKLTTRKIKSGAITDQKKSNLKDSKKEQDQQLRHTRPHVL